MMTRIDNILYVIRNRTSKTELSLGYHDWFGLEGGPTEIEWEQLIAVQRDRLLDEADVGLRIWILAELISVCAPLNSQSLSTSREDDLVALVVEQVKWLLACDYVIPSELDPVCVIIINLLESSARSPLSSLDDSAHSVLKRIVGNARTFSGVALIYAKRALEVLPAG